MTLTEHRAPATLPLSGRASTATAAATLVVAVVAVSVASVLVGSRMVSPFTLFDGSDAMSGILEARVPRTAVGLALGAALGLAGACMQGLTRNPLADPGILGVNAGAAFAMVVGLTVFGASQLNEYLWFAFAGAAVATVAVHMLASLGRDGATPVKLAIAGAAMTAALTSWTSAVLLLDRQTLEVFRLWQVGTIGGRYWEPLLTLAPFLAVGAVLALASARPLNTLTLGEDLARGLGRRTARDRVVVGLAIVLLSGGATALAGPVAFVGLIVPHLVRTVVGSDYAKILPFSMGYGAVLTLAADVVGRVVLPPAEVQVGIMTAVIGVPVFFWMIRRGRLGAL